MTHDQVLDVLEQKRAAHPELREPLTWDVFRLILRRERVPLQIVPLPRPAKLAQLAGEWTIFLNRRMPARRYTHYGAHELAHLWLHVDRAGFERWERVFHADEDLPATEEEDDAEMLALGMLRGERAEWL
jgi:Zn-dependent peptidase ImmA (M78 family)